MAADPDDEDLTLAQRLFAHEPNHPTVRQEDLGFEWNDQHEDLLKKWQERSRHYGKLHNLSGKFFKKFHRWLGLPTKLFLSLIAAVEFSQLTNIGQTDWSFYFNGFVALVALLMETAHEYLGWGPRSQKHFGSSTTYESLAMDIETELCHPREKRTNVRAFLRHAKSTLQGLSEATPDVPTFVLNHYVQNTVNSEERSLGLWDLLPVPWVRHPAVAKAQAATERAPVDSTPPGPTSLSPTPVQHPTPVSPPPPPPLAPSRTPPTLPTLPTDDLQDEFASELQRKLQAQRDRVYEFQVQRWQENVTNE